MTFGLQCWQMAKGAASTRDHHRRHTWTSQQEHVKRTKLFLVNNCLVPASARPFLHRTSNLTCTGLPYGIVIIIVTGFVCARTQQSPSPSPSLSDTTPSRIVGRKRDKAAHLALQSQDSTTPASSSWLTWVRISLVHSHRQAVSRQFWSISREFSPDCFSTSLSFARRHIRKAQLFLQQGLQSTQTQPCITPTAQPWKD